MNDPDPKPPIAWQPVTPGGVAAFGRASWGRLLLVQLLVALAIGGATAWCLYRTWYPVITRAVQALPLQGEFRSGQLEWPGLSPATLAEGRYLAIVVDLNHAGRARLPAHVQVEFGRSDITVYSLFGGFHRAYDNRGIPFNRTELGPWWGAWAPPILAMVVGGMCVWLMASWTLLAAVYALPVWLIGFFGNRACSLSASWKIAGAALMPGALVMCVGIIFYGLGALDLVRLAMVAGLHVLVPWAYVVAGPLGLPVRADEAQIQRNPFA